MADVKSETPADDAGDGQASQSSAAGPAAGQVALSGDAGAFGPWRAHQAIDAVAGQVAGRVRDELKETHARVLVVDDRAFLEGDWVALHVRESLQRLKHCFEELDEQVAAGQENIRRGVRAYEDTEATGRQAADDDGGRRGGGKPAARLPAAGALPTGVLSDAVSLLSLLRTDYAVVASNVSAGPAEIATLTAARLAEGAVTVVADAFTTAGASPVMARFSTLLTARDDSVRNIFKLEQALVPVEAGLAAAAAAKTAADQEWAKVPDGAAQQGQPEPGPALQAADGLGAQAAARERVAGPARALRDYARQVVAEADAEISALLQAPAGGQAPLYTAVRRERLAPGAQAGITHVLYVTLDYAAADAVTRRPVLGGSGILRFLAAVSATWLLMSTETGAITAGGQERHGNVMAYGLASGKAAYSGGYSGVPDEARQAAGTRVAEVSVALEWAGRALVVLLALALAALGVLSVIAVIHLAIP